MRNQKRKLTIVITIVLSLLLVQQFIMAAPQPGTLGEASDVFDDSSDPSGTNNVLTNDVIFVEDPDGVGDVGIPTDINGNPLFSASGWDIEGIYFDYDHFTDTLYVAIDCVDTAICGDADADGNPGDASAALASLGGIDHPDLDQTEAICIGFDVQADGTPDFVVGVGASTVASDPNSIDEFGAYNLNPPPALHPGQICQSDSWDTELTTIGGNSAAELGLIRPNQADDTYNIPGDISAFPGPNSTQPDFIFTMHDLSSYPGFTFTPGESFTFDFVAFAGSQEDDGIGEDYMSNFDAQSEPLPITVTIPAAALVGDLTWLDSDRDGLQDAGEVWLDGVSVTLYHYEGTLVERGGANPLTTPSTTPNCPENYEFNLLDIGSYYLDFGLPGGYERSPANVGGDDTIDSDAATNGETVVFQLVENQADCTRDAGYYLLPTPVPPTPVPPTPVPVSNAFFSISKTGYLTGGQIQWTGVATNTSDAVATNVVLTDNLPDGLSVVSATASLGTVVVAGNQVFVNISSMAPGQSVTVNIVTTAPASGTATNYICVRSDTAPEVCAQSVAVTQLPATGESPLSKWRIPVFMLALLLVAGGALSLLILRRPYGSQAQ